MNNFFSLRMIPTFIFSYFIWCLFVGSGNQQELIAGFFVSLIVSLFINPFALKKDFLKVLYPQRLISLLLYILVFLWEMIKANVELAYRILHPKLPINPGIVKISTDIKSDLGITTLANAITLIPGTITIDVIPEEKGNTLYVHWINVKNKEEENAGRLIIGNIEGKIRRTFQ